jgi:hypothetical protein
MGMKHRRITPLWPKANAEAERFMQNIGKVVSTSVTEHKVWKQELFKFLRNYRSAPHPSTCRPPAVLMLNRPVRIKLPSIRDKSVPEWDSQIREKDCVAKNKMADYSVGKKVLLKLKKVNKYTQRFDLEFYTVISAKGTMITAKRGNKTVTRNLAFFKPYHGNQTYRSCDVEELHSGPESVTQAPKPPEISTPAKSSRMTPVVMTPVVTPPVTTPVRPVETPSSIPHVTTPVRPERRSVIIETDNQPVTPPESFRRSNYGRPRKPPVWMKDYEA